MTREEALKILRGTHDKAFSVRNALETLIPELTESGDERIRKRLITLIRVLDSSFFTGNNPSKEQCLAYLEKQKELFESGRGLYYYDGEKTTYCGYPATEENPYDFAMSQQEVKQKEQNGGIEECTDFIIYHPLKNGKGEYECIPYSFYGSLTSFSEDKDLVEFLRTCFYTKEECNEWIERQKEQKPAEWSEEDEKRIQRICDFLWKNRKGDTDTIYQIEKDVDWLKSLRPSWKPSEEQMEALLNAEKYLNAGLQYGSETRIAKLYEQLKKLM